MSKATRSTKADDAVNDIERRTAALRDRHSGTLRGNLAPIDSVPLGRIELLIGDDALTRAGQLLAVYFANLCGRLEGVIESLTFAIRLPDGASDIALMAGVDPRRPVGSVSLASALEETARLARPDAIRGRLQGEGSTLKDAKHAPRTVRVQIGAPHASLKADVYCSASDWIAHVGRLPICSCDPTALLSFGPHAAAAFAVAEVFRILRATGPLASGPDRFDFSLWSCEMVASGEDSSWSKSIRAHVVTEGIDQFVLAGVGAVGSAFLATLWSSGIPVTDSMIIDGDSVSETNLNRYPLFGIEDVGKPKASCAAGLLSRLDSDGLAGFDIRGIDCWWADYQRDNPSTIQLLVSAVDTNSARHQLQDALPRVILGGSTHELRAEIDRYYLGDSVSRCLKCDNPIESAESDDSIRRRLIGMTGDALDREADDRGIHRDLLRKYVSDIRAGRTGCAILSGAAFEKLRHVEGESAFAVSFVSALAGALLAAQLAREATGLGSALSAQRSRANVQIWRPAARVNGTRPTNRQAGCWCSATEIRAAYSKTWFPIPD